MFKIAFLGSPARVACTPMVTTEPTARDVGSGRSMRRAHVMCTECSAIGRELIHHPLVCHRYLYVHTITHEIRGSQPPGYMSSTASDTGRKSRNEAAMGGRWHAFPTCHLEDWRRKVDEIMQVEGKMLLIIADDPSTHTVCTTIGDSF